MDETAFDIDRVALRNAAAQFPAHRLTSPVAHPQSDLGFLGSPTDFAQHAWDEGGHS